MSVVITRKVSVTGGTVLRAANNLGEVASAATSRVNLGLGPADSPTFAAINSVDGSHAVTYLEYLYLEGLVDL